MDFRLQSPYCNTYKVPSQQKGLIIQHLIVRKLTRRELEDKYLRLIDENYDLKRENNDQKEKIKVLTTKLLRSSRENSKYKSREFLFMDENNEIQEAEEFFRPRPRRPVSSSAIPRNLTRNSTPNLASKFKGDFFLQENLFVDDNKPQQQGDTMEDHRLNNKNSFESSSSQREDQIDELTTEIKKLQDIVETNRKSKEQMEIQVAELKQQLKSHEIEKQNKSEAETEKLNKKIKELQTHLDEVDKNYQQKINECTKEKNTLNTLLDNERQKMRNNESSQKMIDELMARVAEVEKEKAALANQHESYAEISSDFATCKKKMSEMSQALDAKEKALEKEKADKASIEHSQEELLKKMKELQKENDQLVVKLEGLKTENEELITKNKKLESRFKILEDQNKQQLKQINEALKTPIPSSLHKETSDSTQLKTIEKAEKIRKTVEELPIASSIRNETSQSNTLNRIPSPQQTEKISPVKSVSKKELKIAEPLPSPSISSVARNLSDDQVNTSTINSQDVPNIPKDSPIAKGTFAEIFSRSVSKDAPSIDDDFDPNTFSIDQVSDASDGVSELIEDEQDYEYLFNPDNF